MAGLAALIQEVGRADAGRHRKHSQNAEPLYDWHVLYTRYLERILRDKITCFTMREMLDAEALMKAEMNLPMWRDVVYAVDPIVKRTNE